MVRRFTPDLEGDHVIVAAIENMYCIEHTTLVFHSATHSQVIQVELQLESTRSCDSSQTATPDWLLEVNRAKSSGSRDFPSPLVVN